MSYVRDTPAPNPAFQQLGQDARTMSYNRYYTVVEQDIITRQQYAQSTITYKLGNGMVGLNTNAPTAEMQPR